MRSVLRRKVQPVDECNRKPLVQVLELPVLGAIARDGIAVQSRYPAGHLVAAVHRIFQECLRLAGVAVDDLLVEQLCARAVPLVGGDSIESIPQGHDLGRSLAGLDQDALRVQYAVRYHARSLDLLHLDADREPPLIEVDHLTPDLKQVTDELQVAPEDRRKLHGVAEQMGLDPLPRAGIGIGARSASTFALARITGACVAIT
jgi:hypothetical protein